MRSEAALSPSSPSSVLSEAFWNMKARRIRVSPVHTTRASSLGHECERFLFYERTESEMRVPHSPESQCIFDLGNHLEDYVLRELEDMRIRVYQRGRDYEEKRLEMTGHIDAKLSIPGFDKPIPAEIKGLNPFTAERIQSVADIRDSKQSWVRKYYAQLQTYLYLDGSELGVFVLLNKVSGQIHFYDCPLDYAFAESLLQKAERIRDAVAAKVAPERNVSAECQRCPFLHVCKPDLQFGDGVEFWDDAEVVEMVKRRAELEAAAREFDDLDHAIKKRVPHKPELLCGEFVISGKEVTRKGYEVKPSTFWQVSIRKITGGGNAGQR